MVKKIGSVSFKILLCFLLMFCLSLEAEATEFAVGTDSNGGKHYYVDGNEVSEATYHECRKNDCIAQMEAKGYVYVSSMDELRNKAATMSVPEQLAFVTPFSISNGEFEQLFGINRDKTYFNLAQYGYYSSSYTVSSKITNDYELYQISYTPEKLTKDEYNSCYGIANQVSSSFSGADRYGKVKGVFEWLCNNITYDTTYSNHTLSSALQGRNTVCEGYAMSFQLMMNQLGIPCYIIVDDEHAWNAVQMEDGVWYLVDATWGDQDSFIDYDKLLFGVDNDHQNTTPLNISRVKYCPSSSQTESGQSSNAGQNNTQGGNVEQTTIKQTVVEETTTEETTTEEITTEEVTTEDETTETETSEITTTEREITTKIKETEEKNDNSGSGSAVVTVIIVFGVIAGASAIGGAIFYFVKK